jgi:lysophospholipase L1-like esterase
VTPTETPAPTYPHSITALGDSITAGYDVVSFGYNWEYSWSTGNNISVNSFYQRLLAINSPVERSTLAVSGAKMVDLNGQAALVSANAEFITILIGANDICTPSVDGMTTVADFTSQFTTAMNTLTGIAPNAKIYVISIPNIYQLWDVLHNNSSARILWSLGSICPSMLANPTSTLEADVQRRATVAAHNAALNDALKNVCATYATCRFDNYAVFNTPFLSSDVSTVDYFHPAVSGQAKLANVTWMASEFYVP